MGKINSSKTKSMVLDRKTFALPHQVGGEPQPKEQEFKHLGVLFMNEGRMEQEISRQITAASAIL